MQKLQGDVPKSLDAAGSCQWLGRQWLAFALQTGKINQITIPNMQLMSSEVVRPIANPISRLVMANWKCAMAGY